MSLESVRLPLRIVLTRAMEAATNPAPVGSRKRTSLRQRSHGLRIPGSGLRHEHWPGGCRQLETRRPGYRHPPQNPSGPGAEQNQLGRIAHGHDDQLMSVEVV